MLVTIYANIYASAWWTWIVWYWNSWPSCGHIFTKKTNDLLGKLLEANVQKEVWCDIGWLEVCIEDKNGKSDEGTEIQEEKTPLKKVVNWWLICVCPCDFLIGENPWYLDPEVLIPVHPNGVDFPGIHPNCRGPNMRFSTFWGEGRLWNNVPPPQKKIPIFQRLRIFFLVRGNRDFL